MIREINREPVNGADEAIRLIERIKGDRVLLRVWSQGGSRFLVLEARAKQTMNPNRAVRP